MNKIKMVKKLWNKIGIDPNDKDIWIVNIPCDFITLINKILIHKNINTDLGYIDVPIDKNEKDFPDKGNAKSALKMFGLIDSKHNTKKDSSKWYIPAIKDNNVETHLQKNSSWYLGKTGDKPFKRRIYTAGILFISNSRNIPLSLKKDVEKLKTKKYKNINKNFKGIFEMVYSSIFQEKIDNDKHEVVKAYEEFWLIKKNKYISKARDDFRNNLISNVGYKNMNNSLKDFPHLEAAHLISVHVLVDNNKLDDITNPLNGLLIDPNLHKIIDISEDKDVKSRPTIDLKTGEIVYKEKIIANIDPDYLIERKEYLNKSKKFNIINK